jgi:hypothetical protein
MIEQVINLDENQIPQEGSTTFRSDASYVWRTLPDVIKSMNVSIDGQNLSAAAINTNAINASRSESEVFRARDEAQSAKNTTENLRNEVVLAKEEIQGYVIPDSATYGPKMIDDKLAMIQTLNLTGV